MSIDETRAAWATGGSEPEGHRSSDAELLELVLSRSAAFQRRIRWRDLREIVAAVLVLPFFVPVLLAGSWLARAGVLLIAGGCALIVFRLTSARRLAAPGPDRPLVEALRAEHAQVRAQARLLETVLYWYVAPLAVGSLMVVVGISGRSWFTFWYTLAVVLLSGAIFGLNRGALKRQLRPRLAEIERLLAELEG